MKNPTQERQYLVAVVNLRAPAKQRCKKSMQELNPQAGPKKPVVKVMVKSVDGGEEVLPNTAAWDKAWKGFRPKPKATWHKSKIEALERQEDLVAKARAKGWWVQNGTPRRTYRVYEIPLDPAVAQRKAFRKKNPHIDWVKSGTEWTGSFAGEAVEKFFYVGQTGEPLDRRMDVHLGEAKGSRVPYTKMVKAHHQQRKIRPVKEGLTELESLQKECHRAKRLRKRGAAAYFG